MTLTARLYEYLRNSAAGRQPVLSARSRAEADAVLDELLRRQFRRTGLDSRLYNGRNRTFFFFN